MKTFRRLGSLLLATVTASVLVLSVAGVAMASGSACVNNGNYCEYVNNTGSVVHYQVVEAYVPSGQTACGTMTYGINQNNQWHQYGSWRGCMVSGAWNFVTFTWGSACTFGYVYTMWYPNAGTYNPSGGWVPMWWLS